MTEVEIPEGSVEYLFADVTADQTLDAQPVEIGVGRTVDTAAWEAATWLGDAGTTRTARILLDGTLEVGKHLVFVRVTDNPEVPIVKAGVLRIKVN